MEAIQLQFPTWYLILCLGLGVLFAILLYFRDKTFKDHAAWVRWVMSTLRFLSATAISMLLLSPFLRRHHETVQNPVIVIGQDNSSSISGSMTKEDSAAYLIAFDQMVSDLREAYDVRVFSFGEAVVASDSFGLDEKITDISQFLNYTTDHFGDQNLGAVVLATDGLYNRGTNPLYLKRASFAPVYAIALGDTTVRSDMTIARVLHNKIAFLGDKFPVQIDFAASKLYGRDATITVERIEGRDRIPLSRSTFTIDSDQFFRTEEIFLEAATPGVTRYRATLSGIRGEVTYRNNSRDFYIEVIDGRVNVLILANSPHPDVAAIYATLQEQQNYTAEIVLLDAFNKNLKDYDLVVLHQLPGVRRDISRILTEMDALGLPRLFIIGSQTSLPRFNNSQPYLQIRAGQQATNEVTALVDTDFDLFTVPEDLAIRISRFAPLQAPFGQYTADPSVHIYLWQRIGKVDTEFPLLLFGEGSNGKTAVLTAEGFWRWRLYDFMQHGTHELSHTLLSKTIQFLTVKEDKRRFRAAPSANLFQDNEPIAFDAELYNRSYEHITDPDVFLEVSDEEGNTYHYTFSKNENTYALSLGKYPVGAYRYMAFTDYEGKRHQVTGRFTVQLTELESYITTADHRILHALTSQSGGTVAYPEDIGSVSETLLSDQRIKPVMYQSVLNDPLIHLRWLFFVFLVLLGLEWFIRRYLGGY